MRDPYDVLGVARSAGAADIKRAFRKQAKKLHPDANKNDPKAAARFAELNSAYEIIGDDDKRKAFDRGEIDTEGKQRFRGFEGFGGGHPGGFGGRAARGPRAGYGSTFAAEDFGTADGGHDVAATLTITLPEAAGGIVKRVHLPTGKEVEVKIPAGLADGQQIRLKGQGLSGPGGVGDVLITVTIAPHPLFTREGADLRLDLPVTLYEAVLGGKVRVPTLSGAVDLAIPAGTSSGRTFRLKGKGLKSKDGQGDLFATIRIVLPAHSDPELDELMRKWRDAKPYDPRRDMK
jgi:DnaJ-class molecular chaperone